MFFVEEMALFVLASIPPPAVGTGFPIILFQTGSVPQAELITAEQEAHTTQSASSVPYDEARLERENGQSAPDLD